MTTSVRDGLRTRWGLVAAGLVALGVVVLLIVPSGGGSSAADGVKASSVQVLRGAFLRADSRFAADPLLRASTTPLVVLTPLKGGRRSEVRVIVRGRVSAVQRLALAAGPGDLALVNGPDGRLAVALLRHRGATLQVSAASFESGRALPVAQVPVPTHAGGVDARLALGVGATTELFVLAWPRPGIVGAADRATGLKPLPRLRVLAAAGGFGHAALTTDLPLLSHAAAEWELLVARISGPAPDLLLIHRAAGARPEVHVLSGESGFHQFILHAKLDLSAAIARRASFVPALEDGRPVLRVIEPGAGRATVRVFPLGSAPPAA